MKSFIGVLAVVWALPASSAVVGGAVTDDKGHHHHKGHHHKHHKLSNATAKENTAAVATKPQAIVKAAVQEGSIVDKMRKLETQLAAKAKIQEEQMGKGHILVNGPLPADFNERFAQAVGHATGADAGKVKVTETTTLDDTPGIVEVEFEAPRKVVKYVENGAADPESTLAKGNLRPFLIAKSSEDALAASKYHTEKAEKAREVHALAPSGPSADDAEYHKKMAAYHTEKAGLHTEHAEGSSPQDHLEVQQLKVTPVKDEHHEEEEDHHEEEEEHHHDQHLEHQQEATPVEEKGIDIDTQMPYGDLEPFGREDTAQELTESSVRESDGMVDQLERAEVAEEKRSVFRALTRLRGAAITSFDGVARSQTGNIDEYNKIHKWRKTHPLHHLADEESDVSKWAFPDNADF